MTDERTDGFDGVSGEDPGAYCRAVEAHLCRRNGGHLVRIVGPAFELVCGWAARGVPVRVACRGIDRTVERAQAKGERRRPVRIEFCEADVLDLFDEWRRAVGVSAPAGQAESGGEASRRQPSLAAHLERVVARLTTLRAGGLGLDDVVDGLVTELDRARATAKGLRGEARAQQLDRLRQLDAALLSAARQRVDAAGMQRLSAEADQELRAFKDRMPPDAYAAAHAACVDRLIRDRFRLPVVALD